MASNPLAMASNLQPNSDGLQTNSDGLQLPFHALFFSVIFLFFFFTPLFILTPSLSSAPFPVNVLFSSVSFPVHPPVLVLSHFSQFFALILSLSSSFHVPLLLFSFSCSGSSVFHVPLLFLFPFPFILIPLPFPFVFFSFPVNLVFLQRNSCHLSTKSHSDWWDFLGLDLVGRAYVHNIVYVYICLSHGHKSALLSFDQQKGLQSKRGRVMTIKQTSQTCFISALPFQSLLES